MEKHCTNVYFMLRECKTNKQGLSAFSLPKDEYKRKVTKIGKKLRKYKIDELPQLINVFRGDMSFVGPRPVLRKFVNLYSAEQMHVLDMRPGITDMASIKYRNEIKILNSVENPDEYYEKVIMQDKLALNLEYIKHHSLWLDLKLIFKTIFSI